MKKELSTGHCNAQITLSCNFFHGCALFESHEANDAKDDKTGEESRQHISRCYDDRISLMTRGSKVSMTQNNNQFTS